MNADTKEKLYIIVIDDDPVMRLSCSKILDKDGYFLNTFEDGEQGLEQINKKKPDLLVVDLKMPKIGGMEVIKKVHEIDPEICIVVITGYATIGTAVEAMKAGAYDFLPKPFTPDELRIIVRRGLERTLLARKSIQLKREKENLERRFITFVSHQLQSPLVAVQQYLEVLNHLENTPDKIQLQKEWISRSICRIKELKELVNDWLIISKIESGKLAECTEQVMLLPIIEDVVHVFESLIKEKNISLSSNFPEKIGIVIGHEDCLKMLFTNLIHNAIKYNKKDGKLIITADETEDSVIVKIEDTGIGIPEDKLNLIFEEFYRVKCEQTKDIPGTGLGLAICHKIVKVLSGKIEVSSKIDYGSSFKVVLPKYKDKPVD